VADDVIMTLLLSR